MVDKEQGTETKDEGAEKATPPEGEPTVYKTYTTEEDYQKDIQSAVSKGLESVTKQLSLRNGEVKATQAKATEAEAKANALEAQVQLLRKEADELLADDPERRAAYTNRLKVLEREQEIASKNAEAEQKLLEAEKLAWSGAMALKSIELKKMYKVPQEVLDTCITEEQMETIAKSFPKVEEEEKEPELDSTTSTAAAPGWRDLNAQGKVLRGLGKYGK